MTSKKKDRPGKHGEHAGAAHTDDGDGAERVSPPATGVAPDVRLLGPDEIRATFDRAAERDALAKERDDLKARLLRAQADLENFRRREVQERRRAAEEEADRVLSPVLDALDSFTRAVESAEKVGDLRALLEGLNLAFRELERRLADHGVSRIEGTGQAFNPSVHQAVMQVPSPDKAPMTVVQVLGHGWRRGERVLRPAQVAVAAPAPGKEGR
jgi:molecular chaperone GrpE